MLPFVGAPGFFDTIRLEWAPWDVRVVLACPGFVDTPIRAHAMEGGRSTRSECPDRHPMPAAVRLSLPHLLSSLLHFCGANFHLHTHYCGSPRPVRGFVLFASSGFPGRRQWVLAQVHSGSRTQALLLTAGMRPAHLIMCYYLTILRARRLSLLCTLHRLSLLCPLGFSNRPSSAHAKPSPPVSSPFALLPCLPVPPFSSLSPLHPSPFFLLPLLRMPTPFPDRPPASAAPS